MVAKSMLKKTKSLFALWKSRSKMLVQSYKTEWNFNFEWRFKVSCFTFPLVSQATLILRIDCFLRVKCLCNVSNSHKCSLKLFSFHQRCLSKIAVAIIHIVAEAVFTDIYFKPSEVRGDDRF